MDTLKNLPASLPGLYDPSFSLKLCGVAGKYDRPEGPILRIPEHTVHGSNEYHRSPIEGSVSAGHFPASLWLLVERLHLLPASLALPPSLSFYAPKEGGSSSYLSTSPATLFQHFKHGGDHPEPPFDSKAQKALEEELISLAKRYTADLGQYADKDKGQQLLKFLAFAKQYEILDEDEAKEVLDKAAKSLANGFDEKHAAIRSTDAVALGEHKKTFTPEQSHFLVSIDSLATLPLLFNSTKEHAHIAEQHAETVLKNMLRNDGKGVYELVNLDKGEKLHIHGSKDGSGWSQGTAWAIYGFAHVAQATGREEFAEAAAKLATSFFAALPTDGVPYWDAHVKSHRDATAATIAASGLLTLYKHSKDEAILAKAFKLIKDTLALCKTGRASARSGGIDMGKDGWETLLKGSTEDGKHEVGTAYADYYLLEFGNEALKLQKA